MKSVPKRGSVGSVTLGQTNITKDPTLPRFGTDSYTNHEVAQVANASHA
jgi:hypothetical protein